MRNPGSLSSSSSSIDDIQLTPSKINGVLLKRKRGPWTPEEDELLSRYVKREGEGRWRILPKCAGLLRCGKSCRLRWMNYLRPSVKHGPIAPDEEDLILRLHRLLGNRWALIAGRIPGRTDNVIKNYWNIHLSKKLINQGIDPRTHKPFIINPNPNSTSSRKFIARHDLSTPPINPNPKVLGILDPRTHKPLIVNPNPNSSNSSRELMIVHPDHSTPPIIRPKPAVSGLGHATTSSVHVDKMNSIIINNNDIGDDDDHGFSNSFLNSLLNNDDEDISISNQQYIQRRISSTIMPQGNMMMMMSNWETEFASSMENDQGFSNYPSNYI